MKKQNIFIMFVLLISLNACGAGIYNNNYKTENGQTGERGFALIPKQVSPVELAHADLIRSQTEMNKAMAEAIKQGKSGTFNKKIITGIIINELTNETIIVSHPEMNQKIIVPPGESSFMYVEQIPNNLFVRDSKGRHRILQTFASKKKYNGQAIEFGIRIIPM